MRTRVCSLRLGIALFAFFLLPFSFADAADWSHWRGPFQTGFSPETDLPSTWSPDKVGANNLIWKAPYGCRSTPLVMNGRVSMINYIEVPGKPETIQERVMSLDANTGKLLWEYNFNVWHTDIVSVRLGWTNPAGDPKTGNIYAHGTQGLLLCLSKDGKLLWSRSLTEEYGRISGYGGRVTSPIVDGDLVIIGMVNSSWGAQSKGANRFVAFHKDTGKVVWWCEVPGQPRTYYSGLVVAVINGERLLISGTSDGAVVGIKVHTGELAWSYTFGANAINSSPVVEGNYVYLGHGEESADTNVQGRVVCVDAAQVKDGKPKLVWQQDGIKARYASPLVHEGVLYVPDEIGKLHCLDAKTGEALWRRPFNYGRNARGSPVLADGKIYIGEVNSRFHILKPARTKCTELHEQFFPAVNGDVEINGSPAIANGRVYFATSDEFYCIGNAGAKPAAEPVIKDTEGTPAAGAKAAHLQLLPADVAMHAGESVKFKARLFDDKGRYLRDVDAKLSLPAPVLPTGKTAPPLQGDVTGSAFTAIKGRQTQQGLVKAEAEGLSALSRLRVVPRLPYVEDFSKVPVGGVPGGWINAQGKFLAGTLKDVKVFRKDNIKPNPLFYRGNTYIGLPSLHDYTIEADLMGTKVVVKGKKVATDEKDQKSGAGGKGEEFMPDMGIVANRYTLMLAGNIQKLRIVSWSALPRIDETMDFTWNPGVWYRLKLTVNVKGEKAIVRGKVWQRDAKEPAEWTISVTDPRPNTEGCPALYGYVTGITDTEPGTEIYYANVSVTPNKK